MKIDLNLEEINFFNNLFLCIEKDSQTSPKGGAMIYFSKKDVDFIEIFKYKFEKKKLKKERLSKCK